MTTCKRCDAKKKQDSYTCFDCKESFCGEHCYLIIPSVPTGPVKCFACFAKTRWKLK